jgi:hypothetical protein
VTYTVYRLHTAICVTTCAHQAYETYAALARDRLGASLYSELGCIARRHARDKIEYRAFAAWAKEMKS